jgi:hypothetical protein
MDEDIAGYFAQHIADEEDAGGQSEHGRADPDIAVYRQRGLSDGYVVKKVDHPEEDHEGELAEHGSFEAARRGYGVEDVPPICYRFYLDGPGIPSA